MSSTAPGMDDKGRKRQSNLTSDAEKVKKKPGNLKKKPSEIESQMHILLQLETIPDSLRQGTVVLNVISGGKVKKTRFRTDTKVKTVIELCKATEGLFLNRGGIWMENNRTLASYYVEDNEQLEVKKKPKKEGKQLSVILPSGDIEQIEYFSTSTGRGLLLSITNKPPNFDLATSACFLQRNGQGNANAGIWIEPLIPLSFYDLKPGSIVIYGERPERNTQQTIQNKLTDDDGLKKTERTKSESFKPQDSFSRQDKAALQEEIHSMMKPMRTISNEPTSSLEKIRGRAKSFSIDNPDMNLILDGDPLLGLPLPDISLKKTNQLSNSSNSGSKKSNKFDKKITVHVLVEDIQSTISLTLNKSEKVSDILTVIFTKLETTNFFANQINFSKDNFALFLPTQKNHLSTTATVQLIPEDLLIFKKKTKNTAPKKTSHEKRGSIFKSLLPMGPQSGKVNESSGNEHLSSPSRKSQKNKIVEVIDEDIVIIFIALLKHIKAADEEGIFRISANSDNVTAVLSKIVNSKTRFNYEIVDKSEVHELAGAFKTYLRKSKPAIPTEYYDQVIDTFNGHYVDVDELKRIISCLPQQVQSLLGILISYLATVQEKSQTNLMSSDNLGIVFGPTLLSDPSDIIDVGKMSYWSPIVATMIENCNDLFAVAKLEEYSKEKIAAISSSATDIDYHSTLSTITKQLKRGEVGAVSSLQTMLADKDALQYVLDNKSKKEILDLLVSVTGCIKL